MTLRFWHICFLPGILYASTKRCWYFIISIHNWGIVHFLKSNMIWPSNSIWDRVGSTDSLQGFWQIFCKIQVQCSDNQRYIIIPEYISKPRYSFLISRINYSSDKTLSLHVCKNISKITKSYNIWCIIKSRDSNLLMPNKTGWYWHGKQSLHLIIWTSLYTLHVP